MKSWLIGLLLLAGCAVLPAPAFAVPDFQEDVHYHAIFPEQPGGENGKIQVVELFWYGCPHCYDFEPFLRKWLASKPEDVEFVRIPAVINQPAMVHAQAYYTAELLGVLDKLHGAIFKAMHEQKRALNTADELEAIFTEQGVSAEDFHKTINSFAVQTKVRRAMTLAGRYGISGVPAIVVDGKYRTGSGVGGYAGLLHLTDFLIDKARAEKAPAAQAGAAAK